MAFFNGNDREGRRANARLDILDRRYDATLELNLARDVEIERNTANITDLNAHLSALMAHLGLAWERVPEQPASLRVVDVRSTATRATASAVTVGDRITPTDMRNYKRGAKKAKR